MKNLNSTFKTLLTTTVLFINSVTAFAIEDSASASNMPIGATLEFTRDVFMSPLASPDQAWTSDVLGTDGNKSSDQTCRIHTAAAIQIPGKLLSIVAGSTKSILKVVADHQNNGVAFRLNKEETITISCGRNSVHRRNSDILTIGQVKGLLKDAGIILNTDVKMVPDSVAI